ncbi:MAG: methylmalonyl Co-A mutase-associated GTPase MeaB, partial [Micrococcales bacterium]
MAPRPLVDLDSLVAGVREGNRGMLARAITMVESRKPEHRSLAQQLLLRLLDNDSQAVRVGITGVPGVGKSTFIEALGSRLTGAGHRVAVLAVDPSSPRTGGSIMGDKTRMAKLSVDPDAFVRPSPTAGSLGGVARATRETMVVVEAAGYDVVLVETVGVGQSEATVAQMVDCFTVLSLARTGDSLQGIKKGVLELAEVVAINKADGEHLPEARVAARDLSQAIHLITPKDALWRPPVLTCSAVTGDGVGEFWDTVLEHRKTMTDAGELAARRARQQVDWTWAMVHDEVASRM